MKLVAEMLNRFVRCAFLLIWTWFGFSLNVRAQYWVPQFFSGGQTHQYFGGFLGGGISAADFDKDGLDDLLFCQRGTNAYLLKSNGITLEQWPLGLQNVGEIKQLTWVDFDNDGDRDLSMSGLDMPVQLFLNDSGTLQPLGGDAGISPDSIVSYGHSWGDYDRDGDLDLFVCNYDSQFMGYVDSDNQLYRNEGDGSFTDVTVSAGFASMVNYTFMALWMDYNRDLYPDLLVINDRYEVPNYFYHNNGDGTFTEIGAEANLDDFIFGMTATADDFDNDGDLDIYVTNGTSGNLHKINNGDGTFSDADEYLGTTLNLFCWAAQFVDADRDGLQDLHVCSTPHINLPGQNVFFRNNGQTFTDATEEAGISSDGGWSRASAVGDFNGDGLADMAICKSAPSYSSVWRAQENQNHWLKVTLEGVVSNRDGVSAWIDCYSPAGRQSRYTYCGEGYLGQNSFSEFLGFGSYNRIDSLLVTWPSGIVDRWYNIPTNQSLYLVEGSSRRAEIAAADGLVFCEDGFVGLSLGGWQEVEWNNGVGEAYIEVSQQGLAWAFVTDEWGNQFLSDTVLVSQNVVPGIEVIVQDVTCHGLSDGMITLFSDVGGIEFLLNGQPLSDLQNGSMGAGIYELTWTDILGCSGDFTAVITEPDTFEVAVFPQDVTCYGASDGWVDFSFNGGVEGYSILGEDVQLIDLPAGSYNYVASDGNGCLALVPFTIAEPAPLDVQVFSEPDSNGMSSGIIWCLLSGGTPPYQTMLNGEISAQAYWDSLPSGMYALEVTDSQGCLQSLIVEVEFVSQILESAEETIHIYPNPTHSGAPLTVRAPFNVYECVVFDAQGRVLSFMRPGASQFEMNISGYAPGLYVVSLRSEAKHYNHCVVLSVE